MLVKTGSKDLFEYNSVFFDHKRRVIGALRLSQPLDAQILLTVDVGKSLRCGTGKQIVYCGICSLNGSLRLFDVNAQSVRVYPLADGKGSHISADPQHAARKPQCMEILKIGVYGKLLADLRPVIVSVAAVVCAHSIGDAVVKVLFRQRLVGIFTVQQLFKMIPLAVIFLS